MPKSKIDCSNCIQKFDAHYPYCPYCGQKAQDDLTLGVLFSNTISNYFSVDARFFRSFIPLLIKPGYVAKKFIEGKRLTYLHPAQMYLFISVVFFFLFSFISRQQAEVLDADFNRVFQNKDVILDSIQKRINDSIVKENVSQVLNSNKFITENGLNEKRIDSVFQIENESGGAWLNFGRNQKTIDSLIEMNADDETIYKAMGMEEGVGTLERSIYKQMLKFYKKRSVGALLNAFYDTIPLAMFILLPIFALILKLFFYRRGQFAHHLVFSFYYFAFLFSIFSILLLVNFIVKTPFWLDFIIFVMTFIYLAIAIRRFYAIRRIVSIIKTSVITFIYMLFVIPIAAVLIAVIAVFSY